MQIDTFPSAPFMQRRNGCPAPCHDGLDREWFTDHSAKVKGLRKEW